MHILVAVLLHETNTLTPLATAYSDFDVVLGAAMLSRTPACGVFGEAGATVVPTIYASALPSGPVTQAALSKLTSPIVEAAEREPRLDGVWLYLHGAMEVEGLGSGEAWLVSRLREALGPAVPIAVALDFHANLTEALVGGVNIIRGYRTAPHTDQADTQLEAARLLLRCLREGLLPRPVMVRVPMMSPGDALVTTIEPGRAMMAETPGGGAATRGPVRFALRRPALGGCPQRRTERRSHTHRAAGTRPPRSPPHWEALLGEPPPHPLRGRDCRA